ncbi:MAG: LysR family transcriptional regulator [Terriglobales bacterium]
MNPGVDPRVLEYVIAVAEELHFTRAADKLHVAQPSLSRQIRELESHLGARLFERTKQFVRLTPAGVSFVREAKQALLHIERAVNLAKAANQPDSFSLGYSPYVSRRLLGSVRGLFAEKFSRVRLAMKPAHGTEQVDLIRKGMLDGGLTPLPFSAEAIAVQSLGMEPLVLALPEMHRLGRKKTLRLHDLRHLPMIAVIRKLCPQLHERIHDVFVREGFQPEISEEVLTPAEAIATVANGGGFSFVHESDVEFRCPGVVFRPIERQPLALESGIIYRPDSATPIIHALIAAFQRLPQNPQRAVA